MPIVVIKELLGHKEITTTMRYAHMAPADTYRAVEVLVAKGTTQIAIQSGAPADPRAQALGVEYPGAGSNCRPAV